MLLPPNFFCLRDTWSWGQGWGEATAGHVAQLPQVIGVGRGRKMEASLSVIQESMTWSIG